MPRRRTTHWQVMKQAWSVFLVLCFFALLAFLVSMCHQISNEQLTPDPKYYEGSAGEGYSKYE